MGEHLQPGNIVGGKYRLEKLLGSGSMGSVWAARNQLTDRAFAVKFMLPSFARDPVLVQRFLNEARVCGRLDHPSIVEIYDLGEAEELAGTPFLVMELLRGEGLDALLERVGRLDPRAICPIVVDIAGALDQAHQSGIVHRDVKPSNVFLHRNRAGEVTPKLLDFGVSKMLEGGSDADITRVGSVLGSPLYMAPEQARGQSDVDHRANIWALGVLLYEAIAGEMPFAPGHYNAVLASILTHRHRPLRELVPDLPIAISDIVDLCLVKDRNRRMASAAQLANRLESALLQLAPGEARSPAPPRISIPAPSPSTRSPSPSPSKGPTTAAATASASAAASASASAAASERSASASALRGPASVSPSRSSVPTPAPPRPSVRVPAPAPPRASAPLPRPVAKASAAKAAAALPPAPATLNELGSDEKTDIMSREDLLAMLPRVVADDLADTGEQPITGEQPAADGQPAADEAPPASVPPPSSEATPLSRTAALRRQWLDELGPSLLTSKTDDIDEHQPTRPSDRGMRVRRLEGQLQQIERRSSTPPAPAVREVSALDAARQGDRSLAALTPRRKLSQPPLPRVDDDEEPPPSSVAPSATSAAIRLARENLHHVDSEVPPMPEVGVPTMPPPAAVVGAPGRRNPAFLVAAAVLMALSVVVALLSR